MYNQHKKYVVMAMILLGCVGIAEAKNDNDRSGSGSSSAFDVCNGNRVIYTPTLQKDPAEAFTCRVVNVGKDSEAVCIVILGSTGQPLETQGPTEIKPGQTTSDSTITKNTIGYCKVTSKTSNNELRVTLCSKNTSKSACKAVVTAQ